MKKSMKTSIRKGIVTTVLAAMVIAGGVKPVQADSFMDKIHVTDIKQKVEAFLFGASEDDTISVQTTETMTAERINELEEKYPGIAVVDGQYDNEVIYQAICTAIESCAEKVVIYNFKNDVLENDLYKFSATNDFQYFWLTNWYYWEYEDYGLVSLCYYADRDTVDTMRADVEHVYKKIEKELQGTDSPWDAAKYVYEYLVKRVTYDHSLSKANIRNIYGALVEKEAVCAGYAMAFDYIMSRLGYQVGVAGNQSHVWNYMYWDSKDCFIDVTWGDPDLQNKKGKSFIDYSYMGMDYSDLLALDDHYVEYTYISGRGYDNNEVANYEYTSGTYSANYSDVNGYNAEQYSYDSVKSIFRKQYKNKNKSLIVKFNSESELMNAVYDLTGNNCKRLNRLLRKVGYKGSYRYLYNEACKTLVMYLNPKK